MKIYAGSGLNSLMALLAALTNGETQLFDTGVRGNECSHSKQWHLDQIDNVTQAMRDGSITSEQGKEGIDTLTACMNASERESDQPTIHSSANSGDEGVRRFLDDLFGADRRRLESPKMKMFREADDLHKELADSLTELSEAIRENPNRATDKAIIENVSGIITKLNTVLTNLRQQTDEEAPDDVVAVIVDLNKTIRLLNVLDKTGIKIPLILNPNEIPKTASGASETVADSGESKGKAEAQTPVSSDSRGSVQRIKGEQRARKRNKAQRKRASIKRTIKRGVSPARSAAQKARWAKVRAAAKAKTVADAGAKKSRKK